MLWAVIAFLGAFGFAAWLPRRLVRTQSNLMEIHYPVQAGLISKRAVRRIYSKVWLASALAGSTIVALGFLTIHSSPGVVTVAVPAGVGVIVTDAIVRSYRLCHAALQELGFTWPPPEIPY